MGEGFNKNSIPLLFVKGSHFEVGYKVGAEFKTRINTFISSHPYRESILQFYQDASGKEFCDKLLDNCRKLYPHYMDEIKGLAEGAGIPLHELELLHLNKEIQVHQASLEIGAGAVLRIFDSDGREENLADFEDRLQEWVDMGCTDILLNDGNEMIIGHNMDYYVSMGETMYVVCAHILPYTSMDGREFPEEKFVSHQYTGFLFGGNCCFSQHGLVYCVGALFPRDVTSHAAIPELFVRRHFLSATSPADAMSILQGSGAGVATGFAMHFTFLDQSSMWSAEVGPFQSEHVAENIAENVASELTILTVSPNCERPYVAHTNHYEHLRISHYVGQSSSARGVQLDALPPARDEQTVRHTLGNTDDDMLPIYRSSKISKQRKLTQCTVYTGKTSLIRRYTEGYFSPNYKLTIGVDFALKTLEWDLNTRVNLQLWDIAGHERFGHMTRVYYKYAIAAIIVFDLSRPATFDAVLKWLEDVNSKVMLQNEDPIPVLLLANKCDLPNVVVDTQKLNDFCKTHKFIGWFPTSAKDNINVDDGIQYLVQHIIDITNKDLIATEPLQYAKRNALVLTDAEDSENYQHGQSKSCCG